MANVLDQSYSETNQTTQYGLRYDANSNKLAQQFTPAVTAGVKEIKLYLKKNGTITGNVWVELWSDNGSDQPNAQIGSDSATVDANSISTSFELVTFTFATAINCTASTKYWIVTDADYTVSTTNYLHQGFDDSSPSYAGGLVSVYETVGPSWSAGDNTKDFCFYEYYEPTATSGFFALL